MFGKLLCSAAIVAALSSPVWAESTTTPITFAAGTTGTAVTGQVTGRDTADFTVEAKEGQRLRVEMISNHPSSYFNVYAPGATPGSSQALFIGSTSGMTADLTLPAGGTYLIRTYLMPSAGRRDESARFSLTVDVAGNGQATSPAAPSAAPVAAPETANASPKPQGNTADGLSGGPDFWRVTGISGKLNIRSDASTDASVVATAANGDSLRNQGCKVVGVRTWCQVETTGATKTAGWAVNDYLHEGSAAPATPEPASPPAPAKPATAPGTAPAATSAAAAQLAGEAGPAPRVNGTRPPAAPESKIGLGGVRKAPPDSPENVSTPKPPQKPATNDTASGTIPCSTGLGVPTRDCNFSVTREGEGTATLRVEWQGGSRDIRFVKGAPAPQDGLRTERRGDLTVVNIGNERYEIPDAVVFGG
ncbi:SH3 domain-containing protein [Paracoccus aurantiacus]|uniref:SH3 domain-containing protein n=1 Tax=Paracoccus aurantiacus TaxID=2599412 RepID=A0A5C6S237_9RHOB|nr:SH3 domain-containing protein [Paracoccus aurantiacus]TXB68515.1 SH3 domain-containing protein [Paracoccus aurantiacus]